MAAPRSPQSQAAVPAARQGAPGRDRDRTSRQRHLRPLALSVLLGIPYLAGMGIGSRFFHGASERLYRTIAYAIIALAALVSLPVLDSILR